MIFLPSNTSTRKRDIYRTCDRRKHWYVKICIKWLSAYGYDSHGKINDLKARTIAIKKIVHDRKR